jgi:hypothetical protein
VTFTASFAFEPEWLRDADAFLYNP